jgi:hypothetical protein
MGRQGGDDMKTVAVLVLVAVLLLPGMALAGPSTDAALGLGAFAVFNQILSGTGIFGGRPVIVAPQPVVVAPPPPVYVAPAPPIYVPRPVVVAPPPVYLRPAPVYAYPVHGRVFHRAYGHRWDWKHDRRGHHNR